MTIPSFNVEETMELITRGETAPVGIDTGSALQVTVRAPGIHVAWRTGNSLPALQSLGAGGIDTWGEAIAGNGLEPVATMCVQPLAVDVARPLILTRDGSAEPHAEIRAMANPNEGLLLMVENGGIVQWYLPSDPSAAALGMEGVSAANAPRELRFLVPQSTLATDAVAGFGFGSIVHFFKFKIVQELIGAAVEKVIEWIAREVESKVKTEGLRRLDRAHGFPVVAPEELSQLHGRCLLLTHGIFSSLPGAFDSIADPDGAVMQHLRSVYGNNILGWDHWTVSKTPLENARDMLNALPAGMQPPDMMCHSRGALVNRAVLDHPYLKDLRATRFEKVGTEIYVAGACQGSQLASENHIKRLLNIYAAIGSVPALGAIGVALTVVVGVLKVLAHQIDGLPSLQALSTDLSANEFITTLDEPLTTPAGEIIVVHANYDPSTGPLAKFLDLNVDTIFGEANDMVVPFTGAEVLDKGQQIATNLHFGTASDTQGVVMHTNFFAQPALQDLIRTAFV